ncbi:MAG: VanW family protein [Bacillota bacterium]|nr:VanW family protein [Bacillota bacterium]
MSAFILNRSGIYGGIFIDNISVSGLKPDAALAKINESSKNYLNSTIVLKYGDNTWNVSPNDVELSILSGKSVMDAFSYGREGSIFNRLVAITGLWFKKNNIPIDFKFNEDKLKIILSDIKNKIYIKEKSAQVLYKNRTVSIQKEVNGYILDIDKNVNLIENQIREKNLTINLAVDQVKPKITYNDIKNISSVISSTTTIFNEGDVNRSSNIALACKRINGTILLPGEVFSMNDALGPRTIENGFLEAGVIYKNELIKGPGGGICQATTTLYDAVLLSKLQIVERSHHSMPLAYVQPGQDATIAENLLDFKFKNNTGYPVCISSEASGSKLNVRILGIKPEYKYGVKLKSEILKETPPQGQDYVIDDTVPIDQFVLSREAKNGIRVVVYRDTYDSDNILIDHEKISDDYYNPVQPQYKVNSITYERLVELGIIKPR